LKLPTVAGDEARFREGPKEIGRTPLAKRMRPAYLSERPGAA